MPSWKKVILSGSDAALNRLIVTNGITGSLFGTASFATSASRALTASHVTTLNQNVIITGSLSIASPLTFANPGVGNDTRFTFTKTNDAAWLSVVERASDQTYYEFGMSDNPEGGDFFQWKFNTWQIPAGGWMPLQMGSFTNRFVASSNLIWGAFSIPVNTSFATVNNNIVGSADYEIGKYTPTNSTTYTLNKDSGTGTGTAVLNAQSYTGGGRTGYWIVIDAGGTTFTWGNGSTGTTPIATGVTITGAAQTLNNGVTVTLSLTNHLVNDRWSFLCFPKPSTGIGGPATSTAMQTLYPSTNIIGQVIKGASGQTANLQEWQNSSGTVLAKVDALGVLTATNGITGSLFGTASYAIQALSASYIPTLQQVTTAGATTTNSIMSTPIEENTFGFLGTITDYSYAEDYAGIKGVGFGYAHGVVGIGDADSYGVRGYNEYGVGINGVSANSTGIYGFSTNAVGVSGGSTNFRGIEAYSITDTALVANIPTGNTSNIAEFQKNSINQASISHDGTIISNKSLINTTVDNGIDKLQVSGSTNLNGNTRVTGSLTVTAGITGSLFGTASNVQGGTVNYIPLWNTANSLTSSNIFQSSSNIGIGGIPQTGFKLDVNGQTVLRGTTYTSGVITEFGTNAYKLGTAGTATYLASASIGNVGIGTTTPNAKLDVNGNTIITGSLNVTGSITSSGNIIPSVDNTYQLGTSNSRFTNIYGAVGTISSVYTGNLHSNSTGGINIRSVSGLYWGKWFDTTGNLVLQSGSATSPTDDGVNRLQVSGSARITNNLTVTGSLQVSQSILQYSNNASITSGSTSNIASFPTSSYMAGFFDFVASSGTNARAGTVFTVWNGSNVEYVETSTNDIGSTSNLVLSASLSGGNIRLQGTSLSGSWSVKTLTRMI